MNFSHADGTDLKASWISDMILYSSFRLGQAFLPQSVISPSFSSLRQRSLFSSVQLLDFDRGLKRCSVMPSTFFVVESIHPKQRASSTASRYHSLSFGGILPRFTAIQHSRSVVWLSASHLRNSLRSLMSSRFEIVM